MESARHKSTTRVAAPAVKPSVPVASAVARSVQLQGVTRVSSPRDPAEREADATAKRIMRMPAPLFGSGASSPSIAPFTGGLPPIARKAGEPGRVSPEVSSQIASAGSGSPLPGGVRTFMEARFHADFSGIRVHTGERATSLNRSLSAQAFTVGNQIFFARDKFQPDSQDGRELIAHELTHTIQQGATQQRGAPTPAPVQRSVAAESTAPEVSERASPHAQRLGISDALDYFADRANNIPGFRMFTIILGVNPINMNRVERSAANIMRAVVEFMPGGALITQALDNHGVFDRVGAWVEEQIRSLGMTGSVIRDAINRFLDSLSWSDIFHLGSVWDRAVRIFSEPIDRIISFVRNLVVGILRFIKDAILRPLAGLAQGTRGWDLLCAVLGQNPITGEAVPRTAETLIGGFMRLIGQEEIWQNIQRGNAIARAWAWFQNALASLLGFVRQIPGLFIQALQSLTIADIVLVPRAFAKVASVFGSFIGNFLSWAGNAVWELLDIIFSVVAPGVMVYLRRAAAAFRTIIRNPIGFVGNLVRAALQGFRQFAANFLTHLRASLISWITGAMSGAGIYIPQAFTLREIIKFVLSVLGLTWQNIRQKLVRVIGETAVTALETGFDIVVTLVTQGPAAAWEKIQESLSNLREMVIEQVMTFVRDRIVQAAITRLLSMLSPAGAFIQAIIAIYNTIMFFVERLRQIAQVAASFIDSISAIANGVIAAAANRVEQTMAGLLTLVISFLARIAGLGRVSDAVINVVNRVRQPIDRALDRVVDWIVATARRIGRLITGGSAPGAAAAAGGPLGEEVGFSAGGESHRLWIQTSGASPRVMLASANPGALSAHLAEFREQAQGLENGENKTRILAAISSATPLAQALDQDVASANALPVAQRATLNDRIRNNERALRPLLTVILDGVNATVPAQVPGPIAVHFTAPAGIDMGEYTRQLNRQQSAINGMVVNDWLANRAQFATSGRAANDPQIRRQFRERARDALTECVSMGVNHVNPLVASDSQMRNFVIDVFRNRTPQEREQGLSRAAAASLVNAWLSTQAALHDPDQVAGGEGAAVSGLGARDVNSDIGKNWGGIFGKPRPLANELERDTRAALQSVRPLFWSRVRMNVSLTV